MQNVEFKKSDILEAIKHAATQLGKTPSRSAFISHSGINEYHILKYFPNWNSAVAAAGLKPNISNIKIDNNELLKDWGNLVRKLRQIPTRAQYRSHGNFGQASFEHHFGPWSKMPNIFKNFAMGKEEWNDVLPLLPIVQRNNIQESLGNIDLNKTTILHKKNPKLINRTVYGNHIDFRGLRHEPVNENGVIFLFGIVAREIGFAVESIQAGFPDCEAKRQIEAGKWQRVYIEFEYESRNFRDHGHPLNGCDIIVCWRHNWQDCPNNIEIIELSKIIKELGKSED